MTKTDIFRETALEFKETGIYCKYPVGSRSFNNFWNEQRRRCLEGYNVGWDYIPGYFYWYLNFSPIQIVIPRKDSKGIVIYNKDGSVQGDRKEDFAAYWDGDYKYFHYLEEAEKSAKHGVVLKARAKGYSYKGASMLARNYFLIPASKSYAMASEKEFLIKDGLLTKAYETMSFVDQNTPWAKRRHYADTPLHKKASYRVTVNGIESERGYKSEIMGITLKNDPNRARGKRGKLVLWEEFGKLPGGLQAWNIVRDSMEQGNVVYGLMVGFGTGGTEGSDFEALGEMFDNPKGYNILAVNNTWDEGVLDKECAFFVPDYMNLEGFMDEDGTSNIPKALEFINADRKRTLEHTKDTNAYKRRCAEHPITPREAMMKLTGNIFPVQDLLSIVAKLELDSQYEKGLYKGKFEIEEDGKVIFKQNDKAKILYKFPHKKEDNLDAPVILYEQPYIGEDGKIPYGIYIAGIDPYDHDHSQTGSLGSTFIINKLTGRLVAEYSARPETAKVYYEQVRRLLLYYNARALYENNLIGIFDYFESQNSLYLLCLEPTMLQDIIKVTRTTRRAGIRMSKEVKNFGEGLIHQWLISPYDSEKGIQTMHKIRSIGLLEELIKYDPDGNYDRVMSLMCLLYQLNEERRYIPDVDNSKKYKTFTQKDFFNKPMFQKKPAYLN